MRFNPKATLDQSQVEWRGSYKEPVTYLSKKKKIQKAAKLYVGKYGKKAV